MLRFETIRVSQQKAASQRVKFDLATTLSDSEPYIGKEQYEKNEEIIDTKEDEY